MVVSHLAVLIIHPNFMYTPFTRSNAIGVRVFVV